MEMNNTLLLIFSHLAAFCYCGCPKPKGFNCVPIDGKTCVTKPENGTGMNWFQMQSSCGENDGRLVWLKVNFNEGHLAKTMQSLDRANYSWYNFLVIGLIGSAESTSSNTMQWADPNSSICVSEFTEICASYVKSETDCSGLGCCWNNRQCLYPEHQNVTTYNLNGTLEGLAMTKERQCIGLKEVNSSFTNPNWMAFSCSVTLLGHVGFVCEYKCEAQWPNTMQSIISWQTSSMVSTYTTEGFRYTHNISGIYVHAMDRFALVIVLAYSLISIF